MPRAQRIRRSWLVLVAGALVLASCRSQPEATMGTDEFTEAMVERFGATTTQASCITGYVFDEYDDTEIRVLVDEGMGALPQARWSPYLTAATACITHDQPLEGQP